MKHHVLMVTGALLVGLLGCQTDSPATTELVECPEGASLVGGSCVIAAPIRIGPDRVGPAQLDRGFIAQFVATGGNGPYTWSSRGEVPGGLSVSDSGLLSGSPTQAGSFAFTVTAEDLDGRVGAVELTLEVLSEQCEDTELCNGVDDDCDGEVDEDVPGTGEACGPTEGVCVRGTTVCDGAQIVCEGVVEQGEEVCDGVDNDCDGEVDEDLLNACGECGEVPEEVCDDVDNDCDGQTDEELLNACGECGEVPEEVCDGADNDCDGQTDEELLNACGECGEVPEEVCDGADNDCDGQTDEGLLNACGECGEVPEESCDGEDNDCDGEVDEGCPCAPGEEEACGTDVGLCEPGTRRCENGTWGPCTGAQGPVPEVCDGEDNNCEGREDEGVLNACGECGPVPAEVCDGEDNDCDGDIDEGVLNACGGCGPVPTEVCDGEDNDCDGDIDEGVLNACGECGPVPTEVCDGEDNDCDGDVDEGVLNACGECGPVPVEVCDGEDNDCNGIPDDGIGSLGDCANENGFGTCNGQLRCVLGEALCDAPEAQAEVCDGEDNDCDNAVDEDANGQVLSNVCVVDGCINTGVAVCTDGAFGDCVFPQEVCDGDDNDCDGAIDEDTPGTGEACGDGPGVCIPGETVCEEGEIICEGVVLGTEEVCDGEDNDCDGAVDNDPVDAGDACTVVRCGVGTTVCTDGALRCDVPAQAPGVTAVPVEDGFIRAYTGTRDPAVFDNNGTSHSVLITSDGERVYNVAYGIDGEFYAGWTVRTFVPTPDGLSFMEEVRIPVNWDASGSPRVGFAGAAARDGLIYVSHIAVANADRVIWVLDPAAEEAEVHLAWGNQRNTVEGGSEYDHTLDRFWTIQWLQADPFVFRYGAANGIDPDEEEARFRVDIPNGNDQRLGTIASDGVHLYGALYSTDNNADPAPLWQFGSGVNGTLPGEEPTVFTQFRPGASITFHSDGNIYAPDQDELDEAQRIPVTAGGTVEVCDGVDNDCDADVDEGACAAVDLDVATGSTGQVGNTFEVDVNYTVINRGDGPSGGYRDGLYLAHPDAPTQAIATLALIGRGDLDGFEFDEFSETVELPDDTESGDWLLVVVVDQRNEIGDTIRGNNFIRIPFTFISPDDCDPDGFEPNDDRDSATPRNNNSTANDLNICGADEDWFRFRLRSGGFERIFVQFSHGDGNLNLALYDSNGQVASATSTTDNETINYRNNTNSAQDYWLRVYQQGTTNIVDYNLFLNGF